MTDENKGPVVYFIGAGPGAADLITVRGMRLIQRADVVLWADSLVNPEIAALARPDAEVMGTADMALGEICDRMIAAARNGNLVARVHTGDPSIFGAIREQMALLDQAGVSYEVVPGVSSLFGAAAVLGTELTAPEVTQTVIITRAAGRTPVPEREELRLLASHGATMAMFLSVGMIEKVAGELVGAGYAPETPAAVVYRATWPDQRVVQSPLSELPAAVREAGIKRQALILVGWALAKPAVTGEAVSKLYDAGFAHGYRGSSAEGRD